MKMFSKKQKTKEITDNKLLNELSHLKDDFKQKVNEESPPQDSSTNCCTGLFACIKSAYDVIPREYKDIASWLTKLATTEAQGEYNEEVLVSALAASLSYLSQEVADTTVPAQILTGLINEIAKQFSLDLAIEPDYEALENYCVEHKITIPEPIKMVINNQAANSPLALA